MWLAHLFHCGIDSQGTFNLDILTFDEEAEEGVVILYGFFALQVSKKGIYLHFMGLDIIDTEED